MSNLICNKCGRESNHTEKVYINFGYGSKFDSEKWEFNLCDDCLEEFALSNAIKPKGYGTTGFEDYWNELEKSI